MKRRDFLRILGVVTGSSLISSCESGGRRNKFISYILPPEEGIIPGEALFSPSTCTECPAGCGLTVKLREGWPIKLEGAPGHPINDGGLCVRGPPPPPPPLSPEEDRTPHAAKRRGEIPGDFLGKGPLPGFRCPRRFPQRRAEKPLPVGEDDRLPLPPDRHLLRETRGRKASRVRGLLPFRGE